MGLHMEAVANPDGPLMKLRIVLTCDGDHGLLPAGVFDMTADGYVEILNHAGKLGWRKTTGGKRLGPCCR